MHPIHCWLKDLPNLSQIEHFSSTVGEKEREATGGKDGEFLSSDGLFDMITMILDGFRSYGSFLGYNKVITIIRNSLGKNNIFIIF